MHTTQFDPQLKLLVHSGVLDNWKKAPVSVEVSPTNHCGAECPWCFYVASARKGHHSREELQLDYLLGLLDDMRMMGSQSVTWTGGGDPCEYSGIDHAIAYAHRLGLKQGMFTNAYRRIARPDRLEWIRVTVTEKFVLTKYVAEYARATHVGVNFNLTNDNQDQCRRMLDEAIGAGVAYFQFRPALADNVALQQPVTFPTWLEEYVNCGVEIESTSYKWKDYLKPHEYPKCHGHRIIPFVWHDGSVSVCAYHRGQEAFTFGNLHDERFDEIWLGERRCDMVRNGVDVIPECQHCCRLHEFNKALAIVAGDVEGPRHREFP